MTSARIYAPITLTVDMRPNRGRLVSPKIGFAIWLTAYVAILAGLTITLGPALCDWLGVFNA